MPKVSVVIPAYNSMKYLPETVESVFKQTFTDFEILIVNDGSSDNIIKWVSGLVDPRVKLFSQENQGVSIARNTGISNAQGEYVAFLDADDLWEPTKLEKQVRCLDENPAIGLVHTWVAIIEGNGQHTGRLFTCNTEGYVWEDLLQQNSVACSSVMVRRSCFETTGLFDCDRQLYPTEDWEIWIRFAYHYPFAVIKEPLLKYRLHSNNGTKDWRKIEQSYRLTLEKTFKSVPSELQYLKQRSYASANLFMAWSVVHSEKNGKKADDFRRLSVIYDPQVRYTLEYLRLSLAITILRYFGSKAYSRILELAYSLRRRIFIFTRSI